MFNATEGEIDILHWLLIILNLVKFISILTISCLVLFIVNFSQLYCKRCYFRVTKFSRLAAQKHIRGLLNSRWADAHLSFWYCTMLTSFNEWYIYMYVCNWTAQKQSRSQTDLKPIWINTWSIHNSYVSKMCIQNIANIFAGFWIRACWICAKYAKINVPRIFPLLQYWLSCQIFGISKQALDFVRELKILRSRWKFWK